MKSGTAPSPSGAPSVPEIDSLLHEPARLRIAVLLAMVEAADFMYVLRQTGLSRGNLWVQLGKLESAGLIGLERFLEGRRARTTYSLTEQGVDALRQYKLTMARVLEVLPD